MKKIVLLCSVLVLVFALSGCDLFDRDDDRVIPPSSSASQPGDSVGGNSSESLISRDVAIDIALKDVSLARDAVYDLEAELDREIGRTVWEVDFESANVEYSFDIDAVSGEILAKDIDKDY